MAGYGNRTNMSPDLPSLADDHNNTRFDLKTNSHPYTDADARPYGSGATGGAGFGNKSAPDPVAHSPEEARQHRFGSGSSTDAYSGSTEHGSGATGGAGWGNKTGKFTESHDSTVGKLMEKAGHMVHNEKLAEKGRAMRVEQGLGQ
ncbi:hypothetical protein BU24DRAFT_461746 [Aaosphaeria arxii CBS 175.79]|uniref:Uncharacterized protein n=1 Tax=Aaosphaeria arxii CBS 175.79 TaxID=1450172 RepID=A0A6A5XQQ9_9PLEO|nr:uncharacterized protein BU24DRAFT_461746 [Aaosphaeria arxii CBS 175.79]KAF2015502.1 hypothetical protein BU24DRAFT_461746 [Aaosphaeria arxii CBS 175.79]